MKRLVVFGAADLARIAYIYFSRDSSYEVAAFTVDDAYLKEHSLLGLPVVPFSSVQEVYRPDECEMFVAIGSKQLNRLRAGAYERAKAKGYRLASYISSRISDCGEWTAGDNCFILEQNVIQPFVKIGSDVVLWSGNHIGHDVTIEDHCFITSHVVLSGHVKVGSYCFLGVNSCVKQGVTIAPGCLIGAGAVILKDTRPGALHAVQGTPESEVPAARIAGKL
jgi:sugar O-acyltransferase (sialic acid O-acetyltransferase NeuD family)